MTTQQTIGFLGGGNMAEAIFTGLLAQGHAPERIWVGEARAERCTELRDKFGIQASTDNAALIAASDVLLLAVKPQVMGDIVKGLRAELQARRPLLISIAAGISLASLRRWVGPEIALVRCMPNTPALVGAGVSGLYADDTVSVAQRDSAQAVMAAVGPAHWLESEEQIDGVITVSGSGPAYFFAFMEHLHQAGIEQGLDPELARSLVLETAYGAAKLARESELPLAELRARVTSKGGTTAAALASFAEDDLAGVVRRATQACARRARELAAEAE